MRIWYGGGARRCYTPPHAPLGNTGLRVQPIGLGGMPLSIQGRPDERTGHRVIEAFVAGGGNFIDTAISYCLDNTDLGHNERLIAATLKELGRSRRDRRNQRRAHAAAAAGGTSTARRLAPPLLRAERTRPGAPIPLYYLHAVDPNVPFADSLGELVKLRIKARSRQSACRIGARHLDRPS